MESWMNTLNRWFEALPGAVRRYRVPVLLTVLILTLGLGAGAGRIVIDNSLDAFFRDDDPVKKDYERFKAVFEGDEYIYIVYRAKDGDIFSDASLNALKGVYDELTQYRLMAGNPQGPMPLDHIVEIKSLINIKPLDASGDTLFARRLVGDTLPRNDREREALRRKALNHPDYPQVFLSEDSRYGGMLLRTDFNSERVTDESLAPEPGDTDPAAWVALAPETPSAQIPEFKKTQMDEYPVLLTAVRNILAKEAYRDVLAFHPVGKPVLMDFFADIVLKDLGRIMGLVLLFIVVVLVLLFRSFSAVLWPVVIVLATLAWTCGIIGWSGVTMSIMFQIIVFLILAVGIADAVHILSGYLYFRNRGRDHDSALGRVMKQSGVACVLTSVTTAVGLFSLALVPVPPIAVFGLFSAIGVLIALVLTLSLLPLMLDAWNPWTPGRERGNVLIGRVIDSAGQIALNAPVRVIVIFSLLGAVAVHGLIHLRIDSDDIEVLKKELPLRQSYELVNDVLGGSGTLEIAMDFKAPDALKDPDVLNRIQALQDAVKQDGEAQVVKTLSLVNVVKESNKALHQGDPAYDMIPQDPEVLAQTLFLFENANPEDRRRLVTDDYSQARMGIHTRNLSSVRALAFKNRVELAIGQCFGDLTARYPALRVTLTGNTALVAAMLDDISWAQIKSFGLSLIVISLILFAVFNNTRAGLIALIPNLFPIVTTFGLMGYLGIPLDMDTLLIAPVMIGLAVDDTIHFLTHFKLGMDRFGDIRKAATRAISEAGQAISFTSLTLAAGFSMFVLSFHNGLSHFGMLSAMAILTACVADLYLLPALCLVCRLDFGKNCDSAACPVPGLIDISTEVQS